MARDLQRMNDRGAPQMARPPMQPRGMQQQGPAPMQQQPQGGGIAPVGIRPPGAGY